MTTKIDIDKYKNNIRRNLLDIRRRYFRKVIAYPEGIVGHHGDCKMHDIDDVLDKIDCGQRGRYCSCGLIHDLKCLPWHVAELVFPDYGNDRMTSHHYKSNAPPISDEEMNSFLEKQGWKLVESPFPDCSDLVTEIFPEYTYEFSIKETGFVLKRK